MPPPLGSWTHVLVVQEVKSSLDLEAFYVQGGAQPCEGCWWLLRTEEQGYTHSTNKIGFVNKIS